MFKKITYCIGKKKYNYLFVLSFFLFILTILETISIATVIPVTFLISNIENPEILESHRIFQFLFSLKFINQLNIFNLSIIFMILIFILKAIYSIVIAKLQASFLFDIKKEITVKLLNAEVNQKKENLIDMNSSVVVRTIIDEVRNFNDYVLKPLGSIIIELFSILGVLIISIYVAPRFFFILILISILTLILIFIFKNLMKNYGEIRLDAEKKRHKLLQNLVLGIKDIKIFDLDKQFTSEFLKETDKLQKIEKKFFIYEFIPKIYFEISFILFFSFFLIYNKNYTENVNEIFTVLAIYALAAFRIIPALNKTIRGIQNLNFGKKIIDIIYDRFVFISNQNLEQEVEIKFNKNIKFNKINFSYENNKKILNNYSFEIKKGKWLSIIGKSGVGKSTLIDILSGFLSPQSGSILIDGQKTINFPCYLKIKNLSYVPQKTKIFDSSIERNITMNFFKETTEEEKNVVKKIIKDVGLFDINISTSISGYSIGESGDKLSGGQRQRIGIARALYHKPKFLILDEATNAIDATNEKQIFNVIKNDEHIENVIIITHRDIDNNLIDDSVLLVNSVEN
jgi:ATP-binding cassette, subfamily B, bacterial PglK